jgi:hypothetical protein
MTNINKVTRCILKSLLAGAVLTGVQQEAQARDLFTVTATGGAPTVTVGGNEVLGLIYDAINAQNQFSAFNGNNLNGSLNYAGVPNAISFNVNAAGTSAFLNIPSIGFSQSFTGANRSDTESQVENFLKTDGSGVLSRFLKAMSTASLVSVTDGNPNSTTAFAAYQAYNNYAMSTAETNEERESPKSDSGHIALGIVADVGTFDANGFKGQAYSLPLYAHFKLTERVGLNVDIPLSYVQVESADIFGFGVGIGVPIKTILRTKENPWSWQLSPYGGANASASKDFLAGGLIANGGINSLLAYDFGKVTLSMGNHFSAHESVPMTIDGYTFDPGVSQYIIKNGLKLDIPFKRRWVVDFYAVHTKFLEDAALDQYYTVGGELGYRRLPKPGKKKSGYIKFGVYADFGKDYTSAHAQFGTGWKF